MTKMEVKVGERVQAIDELGRWDNCVVISKENGCVTVTFPGWDTDFDVTVPEEDIRRPIDEFFGE